MEDRRVRLQTFLTGISRKLALLVGGSLALAPAMPTTAAASPDQERTQLSNSTARPLPQKLILKQTGAGYKMIAQHDSHSSHSSLSFAKTRSCKSH
jgi:hypothetical protein